MGKRLSGWGGVGGFKFKGMVAVRIADECTQQVLQVSLQRIMAKDYKTIPSDDT